jgi:hypothetical protein
MQFGSEDVAKTVEAIVKYLAVTYESTACRSLNKGPISIHRCMVRICYNRSSDGQVLGAIFYHWSSSSCSLTLLAHTPVAMLLSLAFSCAPAVYFGSDQ